ncbi:MAG: hypothetical protein M3480_09200 [Verrucomicrobiota bacterium]|nr:hypothetical protein [Chthoniobacterales bacterium]MDQ3415125.1 hypothetical protein [Verrucomicrobiota bacterium]
MEVVISVPQKGKTSPLNLSTLVGWRPEFKTPAAYRVCRVHHADELGFAVGVNSNGILAPGEQVLAGGTRGQPEQAGAQQSNGESSPSFQSNDRDRDRGNVNIKDKLAEEQPSSLAVDLEERKENFDRPPAKWLVVVARTCSTLPPARFVSRSATSSSSDKVVLMRHGNIAAK